jgi:integrase
MATIFRKTYTQPLPKNARIIKRNGKEVAFWVDGLGHRHYDQITTGRRGQHKIIRRSPTWVARYRDADGQLVIQSTGCTDEQAARHVLAKFVQRVEHIKAGIISPDQQRQAGHAERSLKAHICDYVEHMRAKTVRGRRLSEKHRREAERRLRRIIEDCGFNVLSDVRRDPIERWMNAREQEDMSARTRNTYRSAIMTFCTWCAQTDRMAVHPLAGLCAADEHVDRRRTRRALAEEEICRLLIAARLRPVAEYGRKVIRGLVDDDGRKTWGREPLVFEELEAAAQRGRDALAESPKYLAHLERLGRRRSLIYKTMILTGLRRGELASLTVGQLALDDPQPYAELLARHEKAGRGAKIPLRADLAADLREYLDEELAILQAKARRARKALPMRLPAVRPLLAIPRDFVKVLNRDIAAAGIPKYDDRGRVVDVHSLRHTFGTHLSKAGVPPRVAQAAMRHSSLALTMNVYTDPRLLDVGAAVDALPEFAVSATPAVDRRAAGAARR